MVHLECGRHRRVHCPFRAWNRSWSMHGGVHGPFSLRAWKSSWSIWSVVCLECRSVHGPFGAWGCPWYVSRTEDFILHLEHDHFGAGEKCTVHLECGRVEISFLFFAGGYLSPLIAEIKQGVFYFSLFLFSRTIGTAGTALDPTAIYFYCLQVVVFL